jgi:hypothetical protein
MSDTATSTEQKPTLFHSLAAMQERHAQLVREVGKDVLSPRNARAVTDFIHDAAATGAVLDANDDRAAAQGLINFWTARLSSAARGAHDDRPEARPVPVPDFDETLLAAFDPATLQAAIARADDWLKALPPQDQATARRVMLRLVRLPTDGKGFDSVPLIRGAFYDLDDPERVNAVIDGLAAAGVIRLSPADAPDLDRVALRSTRLLAEWGAYAAWLQQRREFRNTVAEWDRGGRRPSGLLSGDRLEEVKSYFDRDALERQFTDASRDRERKRNEQNRVLKLVFGSLALVALIGWVVAGVNYHRKRVEAEKATTAAGQAKRAEQAAKDAEDEARRDAQAAKQANAALKEANAALDAKKRLTDLRLLVRGVGELAAAQTPAEQEIALARWTALTRQFDKDPDLRALQLDQLRDCAMRQDEPVRLSAADISRIRRLRNPILENHEVYPTLVAMRQVAFQMVELSATRVVDELTAGQPYSRAAPYAHEFWSQYWGEMLLVESRDVEAAMVAFGKALTRIQASAEKSDGSLAAKVTALFTQCAGEKGKQLAAEFPNLRLNPRIFARVDARARALNVPPRDRKRIQEGLWDIRKEATGRRVTNEQLTTGLQQKLQPLLAALQAERPKPVPPYAAAVAR